MKSRNQEIPRAQAIFHSIYQLKSQYRHSHLPNNGFAAVVAYTAVPTVHKCFDI